MTPGGFLRLGLTILLGAWVGALQAHPSDDWAEQFRVLSLWAESVSAQDTDAVTSVTASGAMPFAGGPNSTISIRHATFSETADGVVAEPVVISTDSGAFTFTQRVLLVRQDDGWRVKSSSPSALPVPGLPDDLPEHAATRPVTFLLMDAERGQPAFARVRITDAGGGYWPPDGHQKNIRIGWRQDVGGDVQVDGNNWAYVAPRFVARLPVGRFRIEVRKGTEYLPAEREFEVPESAEAAEPVTVEVERWINMSERGWAAGDTHTHFLDGPTGLLELRAEDLDVLYVLATKWGELITDVTRFTGAPAELSAPGEIVVVNEETRHRWLGHGILHGISRLVYPLTWGGPSEGVAGGFDYPAMAMQADKTHAQDGLFTWAHFPYPGGEVAVDMALDKVDTVDLFTWGDAFAPLPVGGGMTLPSAVETWYLFLNTNARVPATAGTDKMLNVQVVGAVKTYAHAGRAPTYQRWLEALARGATTVSTGPVVLLTANGKPIGSELKLRPGSQVKLRAELHAPWDLYPVDQLEIVMGGKVVAALANDAADSELTLETTVEVTESTWFAARAHGDTLLPHQKWALLNTEGIPPMAHTSPIYVSVNAAPVWQPAAARALLGRVESAIRWVQSEARYQNEADRQEVLALFERARAHYADGAPASAP